jgi:formate dehydrogenase iron-sulfur subunit
MAFQIMMLIDTSKCIGCKACQVACKQWHSKTDEDTQFTGSYTNPPDKSGANLNVVKFFEHGNNGDLRFLFFPDRCRHCENPMCVSACPLNAIVKLPMGMVVVNEAKCNPSVCSGSAIKPCQLHCPFKSGFPALGVPRYQYVKNAAVVETTSQKCDFCYDRIHNPDLKGNNDPPSAQAGGRFGGAFMNSRRPACELVCPTRAIGVSSAGPVINYAENRRDYLKTHGYPNANIYPGGDEYYVSHMIWILLEDPTVYGL